MSNQTMFWKTIVTIMLLITLYGCTNKEQLGEWLPLEEGYESEVLGEKFGVPNINHVYSGLLFWKISPYVDHAPYAFNWYGNTLRIWNPMGNEITEYKLVIDECPNLFEQLDLLLDAVGESAKTMIADKYRNRDSIFVGHPPIFKIKYYPPDMLGSITLSNIEYFRAQWIDEVKKVQAISNDCLGIKEVE